MTSLLIFMALGLSIQDPGAARPDCRAWQECRQLALDAAARQEFETFHDLAWRAVQTGPKNDPDLLYLLARAQSLSGRPGDALVMLQRLARMGAKTDASTNEDFRRVRALAGWPETEAMLKGTPAADQPVRGERSVAEPRPSPAVTSRSNPAAPPADAPEAAKKTSDIAPPPAADAKRAETPAADARATESLRFTTAPFTAAGLAYDAVSRRFIVGDRLVRKLTVVDEFSHHVANLASAQTSGFGDITALEIDPRVGNLWVVSNDASPRGSESGEPAGGGARATLHKLQLVSGRLLASYAVPERLGAAQLADVAITANGAVIVLDTEGRRLLRLGTSGSALEIAAKLPQSPSMSIAPAPGEIVYVANADGVAVVDLASRRVRALKAGKAVDLARIARFRWHKGSLVGVQRTEGGAYRAIRVALGRNGTIATAVQVLDPSVAGPAAGSATISGGTLYYLAGDGGEMIVRKVALP
jgi:hypothetical protein